MSKQSNSENHSNQLNPNDDAYWKSRGWESRPEDWEEIKTEEMEMHESESFQKTSSR